MRTIDAMKKLARNDGRFTHVYTKKELSELFNEQIEWNIEVTY